MPEMDGYTVLTHLREDPITRDIPVIFISALDTEDDEEHGLELGAVDYINKPIKQSILLARVRTHLTVYKQYQELKTLNNNLDGKVQERTASLQKALSSLETANGQLKGNFFSTMQILSNLLEMREKSIVGHSRRVADNARKIANQLRISGTEMQNILLAGLVHDIGKIGLSDHLLRKPFDYLTVEERKEVIRHPDRGAELLAGLDQFHDSSNLIRWHHERFDGTGFPCGLRGAEIPIGARILAVANDYDALLNGMLINKKFTHASAVKFLISNINRRYDPLVVTAFIESSLGETT